MGNSIEQYRAAIGLFYLSGRGTYKVYSSLVFPCKYIFQFFKLTYRLLTRGMAFIIQKSVYINFYLQFFTFVLLACGDIEVNPGPTTESVLDILHLNIRSIRHKLSYLNSFVNDFDILCFTETHLDHTVNNDDLHLDGFCNILRKDRNSFGGGVMIYLSNQIHAYRRQEFEPTDIECIWIEVDNHTCKYFLCCIYRPPNSDNSFWTKLSWCIDKVGEISDKIILVGDINVDLLNTPQSHIIREIISTHNLINNIHEPTRTTNTSSTLLDPILTSVDIKVCESGTLTIDASISDHRATFISLSSSINYNRSYKRKIWAYKNADFTKLNYLIENCDWTKSINEAKSINLATENFTSEFLSCVRECIPEQTITIRPRDKPWFDSVLRKTIRTRNRLRNKALKTKKDSDWSAYRKVRNSVNNMKKTCDIKLLR